MQTNNSKFPQIYGAHATNSFFFFNEDLAEQIQESASQKLKKLEKLLETHKNNS